MQFSALRAVTIGSAHLPLLRRKVASAPSVLAIPDQAIQLPLRKLPLCCQCSRYAFDGPKVASDNWPNLRSEMLGINAANGGVPRLMDSSAPLIVVVHQQNLHH
jgi:hypothetical protein